eukprot:TCONS_00041950-protein
MLVLKTRLHNGFQPMETPRQHVYCTEQTTLRLVCEQRYHVSIRTQNSAQKSDRKFKEIKIKNYRQKMQNISKTASEKSGNKIQKNLKSKESLKHMRKTKNQNQKIKKKKKNQKKKKKSKKKKKIKKKKKNQKKKFKTL